MTTFSKSIYSVEELSAADKEIRRLYEKLNRVLVGSAQTNQQDLKQWRDLLIKYEKHLEPILKESKVRYVMLPTSLQFAFDMWREHVKAFWTNDEIDYSRDLEMFEKLKPEEKRFVLKILAFFAAADGIVMENIEENFESEVQFSEIRAFYSFQKAMEAEHSLVYSTLLTVLVPDEKERNELLNAQEHDLEIKGKAEFAQMYMSRDRPFVERLFAFCLIEGVFFSASFCGIFYLKKRNLLPGVTFSNEKISADEGLHVRFAILLLNALNFKLPQQLVHEMMVAAMKVELAYVKKATETPLLGMNFELMSQYVKVQAETILRAARFKPVFGDSVNPFAWMETINMQGKTNFFEKRVGEYQRSNIKHNPHFNLTEDPTPVVFDPNSILGNPTLQTKLHTKLNAVAAQQEKQASNNKTIRNNRNVDF